MCNSWLIFNLTLPIRRGGGPNKSSNMQCNSLGDGLDQTQAVFIHVHMHVRPCFMVMNL